MIQRVLQDIIPEKLFNNKAIIIFGARQVGKTTLLKQLFSGQEDIIWLNGDNHEDKILLENVTVEKLKTILENHKILILDEAQRIENIGLKLKIIYDNFPVQIVATGSSSFDLANKINEPMTGRKFEYQLFPLSFEEIKSAFGFFEAQKQLHTRLIYGSYPDVVANNANSREILENLAGSYLYKDILEWGKIKKSDKLVKLLQALAFQIGNQVSYTELAELTGIDKETVEKYIMLLEQSFVIFRLNSFNRNLRNELKRSRKIYFYDNGIRNTLIGNFNPPELRNDMGALWENYMISERKKFLSYHQIYAMPYFWRTKYQQEIDYIEEYNGNFYAFEFKWNPKKRSKFPSKFLETYKPVETKVVHPENYWEMIL